MKIKIAELAGALSSPLPPLVAIIGSEDFLRREAIGQILAHIPEGPPKEEQVRRIGGDRAPSREKLTELFDDLRTPSLFDGAPVIILSEANRWIEEDPEGWVAALEQPWQDSLLILTSDSLDGRGKVAQRISKKQLWIQVEKPFHRPPPWKPDSKPWDNDLNRWIVARCRHRKLKIDPPTAHLLMERTGPRLSEIAATIETMATVLDSRSQDTVDVELVEQHTPDGSGSNLFEVVDSWFEGDRKEAFTRLRGVLHRGNIDSKGRRSSDPPSLLLQFIGIALSRARQLRHVHQVVDRGGGEAEVMKEVGVARPFLPRLRTQARATSREEVETRIEALAAADLDLKSASGVRATELFERLLARS